jgi:hypothetical protein
MEESIQDKLTREMRKNQELDLEPISLPIIVEIVSLFGQLDKEMSPIIDSLIYALEHMDSDSSRTVILYKVLKFYGIVGEYDILTIRQKYSLIPGTKNLQKKPYLKEKDKECINILLKEHDII